MVSSLLTAFAAPLRVAVASVLALATPVPVGTAHTPPGAQCQRQSVPVTLSATDPTVYQLVGWACWTGHPDGKPVEVLVAGFTYDHTYWDFPLQPLRYSYVRWASIAGNVTFAIDRLGTGESSYPPSALLTAPAHVYVLHQLVTALRSQFPGSKVVTVGHSAGSGTALQEAADHADVDGVVLTGLLHRPDPPAAGVFASFYSARLDAKFAADAWDPGYLTTLPGTRGTDFYNTAVADPLVIATDEALKSTGSSAELGTGDTAFLASTSQSIHVPVLLAVGQDDKSFCNESVGLSCADSAAVMARESANFSVDACLEAYVLANAGHDINLHPNALQWFAAANSWVARRVGTGC
jgi:alpha-beta hydrolase superfamily lysophospholipase